MKPFKYVAPESLTQALALFWGSEGTAAGLAGGTELLGLIKGRLASPGMVIDLKRLTRLAGLRATRDGLTIGALTSLSSIAVDPVLVASFAAIAESAAAVGTPQIRNRGTLGGNLCQRPRCLYLRSGFDCYKSGGHGCPAEKGVDAFLAILGAEKSPCQAVHPSDPAVAFTVFDTRVKLVSPGGARVVPLAEFFVSPRQDPSRETVLKPGELLSEIRLATPAPGTRSAYVKVKDRAAFAFALASAAAAVVVKRGVIRGARLALGAVAGVPWRAHLAEERLLGRRPSTTLFEEAAEAELAAARPLAGNDYKIPMAKGALVEALERATGTPDG